MVSARAEPGLVVDGMAWGDFLDWFARVWRPGQHVAMIGPTGAGKTNFAGHLLSKRKYVLATDPKGGDTTLGQLQRYGFERIGQWPPPRRIREQIARGEPARLIVGTRIRRREDRAGLRELLARTIDGAFEEGGWTLYVDELQIAADQRLMNLMAHIEENLISARDRASSVVSSYQRPARVPRNASEMSSYLVVWYTRDRDTVDRIAEMMGRDKPEVREIVGSLPEYHVAVVSRDPRAPVLVTRPPIL